jgi:hypothetical protein
MPSSPTYYDLVFSLGVPQQFVGLGATSSKHQVYANDYYSHDLYLEHSRFLKQVKELKFNYIEDLHLLEYESQMALLEELHPLMYKVEEEPTNPGLPSSPLTLPI